MNQNYAQKHAALEQAYFRCVLYYHAWKSLQNPTYNPAYAYHQTLWKALMPGLNYAWNMELAKLYERKGSDRVTFSSLARQHHDSARREKVNSLLQARKEVIEHHKGWRDHHYAHNSIKFVVAASKPEDVYELTYGQIEDLIRTGSQLLGLLHPDSGHEYLDSNILTSVARDTQDFMSRILRSIDERT